MHETILNSDWDSLLFAVPFVAILLLGFFRLDEAIAAPKRPAVHRRTECGQDKDGRTILTDPDGRRWNNARQRRERNAT
jgi:hypothetical protein